MKATSQPLGPPGARVGNHLHPSGHASGRVNKIQATKQFNTIGMARSKFLTTLFVRRDPTIFPHPFMILSDGGFHKRSCFLAPDLVAQNQLENQFNTRISSACCVVENAFGLLKMKWRRLHQHAIAECTRTVPQIILCACVLHNICIDAGDINEEEDAAVRDAAEAADDRAEINAACERILRNNDKSPECT